MHLKPNIEILASGGASAGASSCPPSPGREAFIWLALTLVSKPTIVTKSASPTSDYQVLISRKILTTHSLLICYSTAAPSLLLP